MRKLYYICRDISKQMSKENISAFASSTAFFVFLSLIPMLIMICTIIPFTSLTEENLLTVARDLTPDAFNPLLTSLISQVYDKSAGILSLAAVATVWSAGKGVLALIRGLNAINGVVEERNYFLLRIVASFYTILLLAVTLLSLSIMVFGNVIVSLIIYKIPQMAVVFEGMMHLRFLLIWAVLTIVLTLLYAYMPSKKRKLRFQIPGAAFSAVAWSAFSWGFSIYVDNYTKVNAYGSLSVILLTMLWLYFCIYIIMVGAYLNRYFSPVYDVVYRRRKLKKAERRKEKKERKKEKEKEKREKGSEGLTKE